MASSHNGLARIRAGTVRGARRRRCRRRHRPLDVVPEMRSAVASNATASRRGRDRVRGYRCRRRAASTSQPQPTISPKLRCCTTAARTERRRATRRESLPLAVAAMHSLQARGVNLLPRPKRGAAAAVDRCSIDGLAGVPKRVRRRTSGRAASRDVSTGCVLVVLASVDFLIDSIFASLVRPDSK